MLPVLIAVVAWVLLFYTPPHYEGQLPDSTATMTGRVVTTSENSIGRTLLVDISDGFRIRLTMASLLPAIVPGDSISFNGQWSHARIDTDLPLEDDGMASARRDGFVARCFANHNSVVVIGHHTGFNSTLWEWRQRVVGLLMNAPIRESTSQFLTAVLTGEGQWIDQATRDNFSAAGVAHVLALSGAHVAVIAWILGAILFPLGIARLHRWRWGLTIALLWGFALLTGMSASVTRSAIMATMVLMGMMLERPRSGINAWCVAGVILLLADPAQLWQPGFQLSFTATLAIVLSAPVISQMRLRGWQRWLLSAVAVTIVATIATGAIVAWHFHKLPLLFILGNIVVVALMPMMLGCGIMLVAGGALGFDMSWVGWIADTCYSIISATVDAISSIEWGVITDVYFPGWVLAIAMVAVALMLLGLARERTAWIIAGAMLLPFAIGIGAAVKPRYPEEELYVTRSHKATEIIYRKGNAAIAAELSPVAIHEGDSALIAFRYRDWLGSRGVTSFKVTDTYDPMADSMGIITVGGRRLKAVGADWADRRYPHVDYLLVTRGFRDSIVWLGQAADADTIVIGTDINSRRARRYLRELQSAGIVCRLLSDGAIHLSDN